MVGTHGSCVRACGFRDGLKRLFDQIETKSFAKFCKIDKVLNFKGKTENGHFSDLEKTSQMSVLAGF